ncbi:MAG TPA: tRNA 2-thiouridine(34) synthase MnmA [Candidatus Paceibacterota bacterium]|nr:tRNA 2-thiouridine(34) synthase MnmA [Candidatus Paceibacterota bacterium]
MAKVFVGMSGGVDSSVTALLLRDAGHEVVGVFMRCYNVDGCEDRDAEDARRVAEHLQIPFYVWDFENEYKERVVRYLIDGYARGETPNPDVMCNREIKFGLFFEKARALGADFVATGHYVRLEPAAERNLKIENWKLKIAKDKNKDQSYFLWTLGQAQLAHCLFPIGDYLKSEVREIARRAGLPTAEKKDSQGICFLGQVAIGDFLKEYIPAKRGDVVTVAGKKIGEHDGAHAYTIGQRHGIGIGGGKPYYVVDKNVRKNLLTVVEGGEDDALYKKEVELTGVNAINPLPANSHELAGKAEVFARVRYRQPLRKAMIIINESRIKLIFDEPVKFVAPGQSAVFYSEEGEMLGGGIIT